VSGPLALHGGGEFLPGDEAFLLALLEATPRTPGEPVRIAVVPVAAARHSPQLAARHGTTALERVALSAGIPATAQAVMVVDAASADDPDLARRLAAADLVHLPGGDPDLVPGILAGSAAWRAIEEAHERGAVLAGASAGAMGLADSTWTQQGWRDGLGLVHGLIVLPHFAQFDPRGREADIDRVGRERLSVLGLDERTGVIREPAGAGWRVAGEGRAVWRPAEGDEVVGRHGDLLPIPA